MFCILDSFQTTTFSQKYLFSFMKLCFCFCKVLCPMLEWIHIIEWCFCLLLQNSFVLKLFLSISYLQMEKKSNSYFQRWHALHNSILTKIKNWKTEKKVLLDMTGTSFFTAKEIWLYWQNWIEPNRNKKESNQVFISKKLQCTVST